MLYILLSDDGSVFQKHNDVGPISTLVNIVYLNENNMYLSNSIYFKFKRIKL